VFSLTVAYVIFNYVSCDRSYGAVEVSSAPECFVFFHPATIPFSDQVAASAFEQLNATAHTYRRWNVHEAVYVIVENAQFDDFYCVPRGGTLDCCLDELFHFFTACDWSPVFRGPCQVKTILSCAMCIIDELLVHFLLSDSFLVLQSSRYLKL
jgi:hypothetical protein